MRIGASTRARASWCQEEAKIRIVDQVKAPETKTEERGSSRHDALLSFHLEHYARLKKLLKQLEPLKPYKRAFEGHELIGDPDWFAVRKDRRVSILEDKTSTSRNLSKFQIPMAQLQVETYCFIMKPILEELGYSLDSQHRIFFYYQRTMEPISIMDVYYNEDLYVKELREFIKVLENQRNPIPPTNFKCLQCKVAKSCRIHGLRGHVRKTSRTLTKDAKTFDEQESWGREWEQELREKLERAGHRLRNNDARFWVSNILGGIKGLDFACTRCGLWFEAKRKRAPFFDLSLNLKPYELFKIWVCFKNPFGEHYVFGKEFLTNLPKAIPLRNQWGEPFYRWRNRKIFATLRNSPPPCEGQS